MKKNVYITGFFESDFRPNTAKVYDGHSNKIFFLSKYGPKGDNKWSINGTSNNSYDIYSRPNRDEGSKIIIKDKILYVAGVSDGNINFGNGVSYFNKLETSHSDFFITSYNLEGVASNVINGSTLESYSDDLAIDNDGNIYLSGYNNGNLEFGNNIQLSKNRVNAKHFVVKYDSLGNAQWAKYVANDTAFTTAIALDINGNLYFTGSSKSNFLDFGNGVNFTSKGDYDFFVVKYDPLGNAQWVINGLTNYTDWSEDIIIDDNGNLYVAGISKSKDLFINNVASNPNKESIFLIKYDPQGDIQWKKTLAGKFKNSGLIPSKIHLAKDNSENIYLAGTSWNSYLDFGDQINLTSESSPNFFIVGYSSQGIALGATNAIENGHAYAHDLFIDNNNDIYLVGENYRDISFGENLKLVNAGENDFFVVKYHLR